MAKQYACKLFVDMPEGWATLREGHQRTVDARSIRTQVTHVGIWINKQRMDPISPGVAYINLAFAPCIGAPDSLSDALGDWKSAAWVEPGPSDAGR